MGTSDYFQDNEARAFATAGIDVLEPSAFTMNWTDQGHWGFDIMAAFNATARGYRIIVIGGDSGGGTVVANIASHYPNETATMFAKAIIVSAPIDSKYDGIFDAERYAGQVLVKDILIIHGLSDTTVLPTQSVTFSNNLPSSVSKDLVLVDGATHYTIMTYATPLIISFIVPPVLATQLSLILDTDSVNATAAESVTMTITATLNDSQPLSGIDVQIQYYVPDNSTWIGLENVITNQTGEAIFSYQPTAVKLPYEMEFRAVYWGNATLKPSISPTHDINVVPESPIVPLTTIFCLLATVLLLRRRPRFTIQQ